MSFKPQSELTAAIFLQFTEKDRTMQFFSVFFTYKGYTHSCLQ